jgi:hypothetical protein
LQGRRRCTGEWSAGAAESRAGHPASATTIAHPVDGALCALRQTEPSTTQLGCIGVLEAEHYMLCVQEAAMVGIVEVLIPVEAAAAVALNDERKREAIGRIVSRILQPRPDHDPLLEAMERFGTDAKAKGLTNETLAAELAAHKAERTR